MLGSSHRAFWGAGSPLLSDAQIIHYLNLSTNSRKTVRELPNLPFAVPK